VAYGMIDTSQESYEAQVVLLDEANKVVET
jgi:hypothetical protein